MSSVLVISAGMLTTVQDRGRYGYQRYGMPVAGAMDKFSYMLANALVGNNAGEACLEVTVTGPELLFRGNALIAICGADIQPVKNNIPVGLNRTIEMKDGDILGFAGLRSGCRSYISFAGGIDIPLIMGSRSTYLRTGTGGFLGRALKKGDELGIGDTAGLKVKRMVPERLLPSYYRDAEVRICPGPEAGRFEPSGIQTLLTSEYVVSDNSDRMGYRLEGSEIVQSISQGEIISAGVTEGTIQVPGNGEPVILMADRQTTGGYPRIASVAGADLTLVAQLLPGDRIKFIMISPDEAEALYRDMTGIIAGLHKS